jgi:metal-responsive CopG/Arc/MetJ family transcriptional regulator
MKKSMTITFRFDETLAKRIDGVARRLGLTRSDFVRRAVGGLLESAEREENETAYDRLKPWIGSVRSSGRHDSRNAGDRMTDDLEARARARRAH